VIVSAEPLEAIGDALLDPLKALLIGRLCSQRQDVRVGTQRALTSPFEGDDPAVLGPFDSRLHLGVCFRNLLHVSAELDQVTAGAFGFDAPFGGQHSTDPWTIPM
jgi:hypothetical protein